MPDSDLILRLPSRDDEPLTEICRSFNYKLNMERYDPSRRFESRDFFCSQKATCRLSEAEDLSERLYYFCRQQVLKDVQAYIADMRAQREKHEAA